MANPPARKSKGSKLGLWLFALIVAGVGLAAWTYREPALGYSQMGTAYAAKVGCSCRFVAGRSLADCQKDKIAGMDLITMVDDVDSRSVTARFPLIASTTATYREGYGCVLERWDD